MLTEVLTEITPSAAAACLHRGGVIAYPTEGVWGLGCDPFNETATLRLLAVKQRPVEKGMILIAGDLAQLDDIADWAALTTSQRETVLATWPGPHTWVVPVRARVPSWITGTHNSIAVRVSAHPPVVALCAAFGGAIVSTSANFSTLPTARTRDALDPALLSAIDAVLEGETGGLNQPSSIRDARSGERLRL